MHSSWDNFERYRQKGTDARRAGRDEAARVYFLQAAGAMLELSKETSSTDLRAARREMAKKLLDLSKPNPSQHSAPSTQHSASPWQITQKPSIRFDDIAGLEDAKQEIRLKMVYPLRHPDLAAKFDIRAGGGVLLYGPPGTGKTMLARATAGEIDAAFFMVSAAEILSKWVGEAEQNVRKLFEEARATERAVIFIDEIDALIPARRDEGSGVMQRVVPQLLQEIDGFGRSKTPVLLLAATNVPWQLDPAVLRPGRFDEKIYVPLPDVAARREMLGMYLSHRPVSGDVDLDLLAEKLEGYSGADIRHLCDRAAIVPFLKSVDGEEAVITREILEQVMGEGSPSVSGEQVARIENWG